MVPALQVSCNPQPQFLPALPNVHRDRLAVLKTRLLTDPSPAELCEELAAAFDLAEENASRLHHLADRRAE